MKRKTLRPGTVIEFCGDRGVVVNDYGSQVEVVADGIRQTWYWEFEGETCKVIKEKEGLMTHTAEIVLIYLEAHPNVHCVTVDDALAAILNKQESSGTFRLLKRLVSARQVIDSIPPNQRRRVYNITPKGRADLAQLAAERVRARQGVLGEEDAVPQA